MELQKYLKSKIGQQLRVSGVQNMTERGKDMVSDFLQTVYIEKNTDIFEPDKFLSYRHHILQSIAATGDELSNRRGKWTTRFRKELKSRDILITDQELGRIGDIVMRYTDQDGPWFVDITNKFDWEDGDFEDKDSCFWSCRSNNRDIMEFYGGLAIRTYRTDSFDIGSGRAWICQPVGLDCSVIFNAYGKRLDKFVHILNRLARMDDEVLIVQHAQLYNSYEEVGFWINQGECYAMSLGTSKMYPEIDLGYDNVHGSYYFMREFGELPICSKCNTEIRPTTNIPYVENSRILRHQQNGERICESCMKDMADIKLCPHCHAYHPIDHFIKDKRGHDTCVLSAHWLAICPACKYVRHTLCHDFETPMVFDLSKDGLNKHCNYCAEGRCGGKLYDRLYGPMCDDCMDEMWIGLHSHDVNFSNHHAVSSVGIKWIKEFATEMIMEE